jgi:hypothetical protein
MGQILDHEDKIPRVHRIKDDPKQFTPNFHPFQKGRKERKDVLLPVEPDGAGAEG